MNTEKGSLYRTILVFPKSYLSLNAVNLFSNEIACFVGKCKPKDSKNPRLWVRVRQCTTLDRGDDFTFKQHLQNLCEEKQDHRANEVAARINGVINMPAADAQYRL